VFEPSAQLAARDRVEGLLVESLPDLRANKLTCLLSGITSAQLTAFRDQLALRFRERALAAGNGAR
jgi:hypothetical protein